jgi:hypothetical protein
MLGLTISIFAALTLTPRPVGAVLSAVNISNNAGASRDPSLGLDGTTLIAVWLDWTPGDPQVFIARAADTGATWGTPVNLSSTGGASSEYDWTFAGRYLYAIWTDTSPGNADIYFRRSVDGGATFKALVNLSMTPGTSSLSRVALSGGSYVYVAWQERGIYRGDSNEIYFKRSTDAGQSFGSAVNLSNSPGSSEAPAIFALGPHVWVLWTEDVGLHHQVYLRYSSNGGATFAAPVNVSSSAGDAAQPAMAVAGPNVSVVYSDDDPCGWRQAKLRISSDGGASFGAETNVSSCFAHAAFPRVIVAGKFVYVTWIQSGNSGVQDVFYRRSINSGATWDSVKNLSNNAGFSFGQQLAWTLAGTELYVAWPDQTSSGSTWDIFSLRSGNAGGGFGSVLNLSANAGDSFAPQVLAVGRDVFAVWYDHTPGNQEILFLRSTTGGFALARGTGDTGTGWAAGTSNPSVPRWCSGTTRLPARLPSGCLPADSK